MSKLSLELFTLPSLSQIFSDLLLIGYDTLIFAAIIVAGWIIGRIVGGVIGRLISRAGGDSVLRQTVVGRTLGKSGFNASALARAIIKWTIYIAAFLIAIDSLGLPLITDSVSSFLSYLPRLVSGVLILIAGIIFSDWLGELVKRSSQPEQRQLFYLGFIGDMTKIVLYFVTVTVSLSYIGIDVQVLLIIIQAFAWSLAIFVAVVAAIIVGWLLKDKVKDWLPS
jgi:small-conductance mechanosensitive channel